MEIRPVWSLLAPALGASQTAYLLSTLIGPTSTAFQQELALSTLAAMMLPVAYVASAAVGAAAGLTLGRRWPVAVVPASAVLVTIGLVALVFAPFMAVAMSGEVLCGLGGGALVATAFALATRSFTPAPVDLGIGVAMALSFAIGLFANFVLISALSWRSFFLAAIPIALLVLVAGLASEIALLTTRRTTAQRD